MTSDTTPSDHRRPDGRFWLLWTASVLIWGFLLFWYRYLGVLADGGTEPFQVKLIEEMAGAVTFGWLFFPTLRLVRRLPLVRLVWRRHLPVYLVGMLAFAGLATSSMWAMRALLFPVAGLGQYDYGKMPLRYAMELPIQVVLFGCIVGGIHAADAFRAVRERELRAAHLEGSLAQAQLRNLRLQLQPHFLFNALNTISATMYRDPAAADEMMAQLAELLRASLHTSQTDEVPLRVEVEVLQHYLAIMRARFGDELRVTVTTASDTNDALVPSMILQPLVENAIRHGTALRRDPGRVDVRATRLEGNLVLEVEDDGPGSSGRPDMRLGVGLSATAERLRLLYGEAHRFEAGNGLSGGFLVKAVFPFRTDRIEAP